MRKLGYVRYEELDQNTRHDVAICVQHKFKMFRMFEDEADEILRSHERLALVAVSPKAILPRSARTSDTKVREYAKALRNGEELPPVVINSRWKEPLCEGFHRTAAAIKVGYKEIVAIDIAAITRASK